MFLIDPRVLGPRPLPQSRVGVPQGAVAVVVVRCQVVEVRRVGARPGEGVRDPVGVQEAPWIRPRWEGPRRRWRHRWAVHVHPRVLLFPLRSAVLEPDFYLGKKMVYYFTDSIALCRIWLYVSYGEDCYVVMSPLWVGTTILFWEKLCDQSFLISLMK